VKKLVFVDESGINTSMTRTRARALPGQRVAGDIPQSHWKTLTMIGAVRLEGIAAAATVDAATDGDIFGTFVRDALVPALHAGDVVVWDNLSAHKSQQMQLELAKAKAELLPLPPYSPDLSPMEPGWSKVKGHVRGAQPRSVAALGEAAAQGFASITSIDARGWFKHCGYCVH
jgi:transposase